MSDVQTYVASVVLDEVSEITLTDPDQDNDLKDYTDIKVVFTAEDGQTVDWPVKERIPIVTTLKDQDGTVYGTAVYSLVLKVIPHLPPPGTLDRLLQPFKRVRRPGDDHDTTGSGTLSGTMNQGQNLEGVHGGPIKFGPAKPEIFFGIRA